MELFLIILLSAIGFILIAKGGDIFVDSAIVIAKKAKIPPLLIGATIVSVGTTLPEIVVSLLAASQGDVGLAVSNATGSMLCNLTLILGVALASMGIVAKRKSYLEKIVFSLVNVLLLTLFIIDAHISLVESIVLLVLFIAFMAVNIVQAVRSNKRDAERQFAIEEGDKQFSWLTILMFIVGAAAIGAGAKLLVDNISLLATAYMYIPTAIVGATVVALGTSLPELVTAINAIKKKNIDMSFGNVLGANIINGTFLVGMSGVLQGTGGMQVVSEGGSLAIVISIAALFIGLLVVSLPVLIRQKTYKWQGYAMLGIYALYIVYIVLAAVLHI